MRNIGILLVAGLVSSAALPSLARKVKKQTVKKQAVVTEADTDSLSANDRKRYSYFFLEAARKYAAGDYTEAFDLFEHARKVNPKSAETYYYLSLYQNQLDNDSLATVYMKKAIALDPENQIYAERLAQQYIGKKEYALAIDAYEDLFARNHRNTDALHVLMQLYQQQKNYPMMLKTLSRIETEEGESEQLTLSKMRVYEMMDDKKSAYKELKSLVDEHPLDMSYKSMLGNWLMQHDRQKEAFKLFTDALKEEPDNAYAQMSLYDYYKATQQDGLAHEMLDKILLGKKTDLETKVMMFRSFIQDNEIQGSDSTEVIALFDRVLDVPEPSADIAEMKAAYMTLKKMPTDSISKVYEQVLAIAPDNADARLALVQNLWNKKDYTEVIAQSKSAHDYNPEEMVFYYFGGMAYYQKMDEDAALKEFRLGMAQVNAESNPALVSDLYAIIGDILHKKGEKQAAFAALDSCLQWKDDNIMALNNYAYYMSESGIDLHKAEAMSYKTIKTEPNNGTYLDTYAWILFLEERYADAKIYIDEALKNIDSTENNSTILEHAGDIYAMNGIADDAVTFWKKAFDNGDKTELLEWKINNRQYITEEALKMQLNLNYRKQAATKPQKATKKIIKKGRRK